MNIFQKFQTYLNLGIANILRVGIYRLGLKTKLHPVLKIRAEIAKSPFFTKQKYSSYKNAVASSAWLKGEAKYFGKIIKSAASIPNWHVNPFSPELNIVSDKPWWEISDFDNKVGDIKTIWEASRFDWLIAMAQRARLGDRSELERLNFWLQDWINNNPPYLGANWKCAQEASIRVMHLALASMILEQTSNPTSGLKDLIHLHLKRIAPTTDYAIGQANNHGISEAGALFIGGSWLIMLGDKTAKNWEKMGRYWLENRANNLIEIDGTFSQYSVTYHRMMLDIYAFCEVWRRKQKLATFSQATYFKLTKATEWLVQMCDEKTGDTPNIGANDGANLFPLSDSDYRDFRPSIQLASVVFLNRKAYHKLGLWDQPLIWLNIATPKETIDLPNSTSMDKGGFHILRKGKVVVYMRYPRFRFRPSQADALHCDIWLNGENIARDAGTYSYNASEKDIAYFSGTKAHNTVEFDGRDQMPRLGRFLFADWLKAKNVELVSEQDGIVSAKAGYRDNLGASHNRSLRLGENKFICVDEIAGFKSKAILRWRLIPGEWKLNGNELSDGKILIKISASIPIIRIALTTGEESRYYLQKNQIPVLEVEVNQAGILTTEFNF